MNSIKFHIIRQGCASIQADEIKITSCLQSNGLSQSLPQGKKNALRKCVKRRHDETIPEFVLLFRGDNNIMLMTYINGIPYSIYPSDQKNIMKILAFLATCYDKTNKKYLISAGNNLNRHFSYLCWEDE